MNLPCPNCPAGSASVVRNGHYFRRDDSRKIQCFKCKACGRYFSRATFSECYRQKKRRINEPLRDLLCKRLSLRDAARHFKVSRTTIDRRLLFLADQARRRNAEFLELYLRLNGPINKLQFDDLITAEHTKCKPVSATVVVQEKTRIIIDYSVAQIPAFGHLAAISRKKYGKRADHSRHQRHLLFERLKAIIDPDVTFRTDEHKHYPYVLKKHFPQAVHLTHKGQRSRTNGQGEMKKTGRDPLFSINQTFGMFRDKMSRLTRQSWNLSKKISRLDAHMAIYIESHNQAIWAKMQRQRRQNLAA
jgi:transposase-like protein